MTTLSAFGCPAAAIARTPAWPGPTGLAVRPGRIRLRVTVIAHPTEDERFAAFVRDHAAALARTAYLLTGQSASAEDLVQDTLLRLYRRKAWLLGADAPLAYARRALTNQFLNERRRRASTEVVVAQVPERGARPDFAGEVAVRDELWALLATLPDRARAAIVLRYYHDLTDADIGAALGCAEGTVRSLISRGLAALRVDTGPAGGAR